MMSTRGLYAVVMFWIAVSVGALVVAVVPPLLLLALASVIVAVSVSWLVYVIGNEM